MASFINKLNPVPAFPPFNGPYNVGTKDVEIAASDLQDASSTFAPVSTIQFRCFYPCEPPSKSSKPVYWVQAPQRSTVSAYCRFSGLGSNVSSILSYVLISKIAASPVTDYLTATFLKFSTTCKYPPIVTPHSFHPRHLQSVGLS